MSSAMEEHAKKYPEHTKLRVVKDQSQAIGDFLSWLEDRDMVVCERDGDDDLYPTRKGIERLLAEYFEIDLNKINAEKDRMVDELHGGR